MRHVQTYLYSLADLHTLCTLPALQGLSLSVGCYLSPEMVDAEGAEGEYPEQRAARVAVALARRALPGLQRLCWVPEATKWGAAKWDFVPSMLATPQLG